MITCITYYPGIGWIPVTNSILTLNEVFHLYLIYKNEELAPGTHWSFLTLDYRPWGFFWLLRVCFPVYWKTVTMFMLMFYFWIKNRSCRCSWGFHIVKTKEPIRLFHLEVNTLKMQEQISTITNHPTHQ